LFQAYKSNGEAGEVFGPDIGRPVLRLFEAHGVASPYENNGIRTPQTREKRPDVLFGAVAKDFDGQAHAAVDVIGKLILQCARVV
jgi:hypothetical protein